MNTLLVCIYFCFYAGAVNGSLKDYAFEFPNKGVTDLVHLWSMRSLEQFTVCFWMVSSDASGGTPFSYAVPEADNELVITNYNNFTVWIGNEKRHLSLSANDGNWHHICVSWENTAGSLNFYKDGRLSASDRNFKTGHKIRAGGSMMLGQNQAGGPESARSFQGFLSNLNVWDYVLCHELITRMSKACLSGEGNVHKWSHFKHGIEGNDLRLFIPSPCAPSDADVDHCASSPCRNNGTCVERNNAYNCSCAPGFAGKECEADIDECQISPCLNNGTCTDLVNGFNCSCPVGFTGDRCEGGFFENSTIIGDNEFYQRHLYQFLAPAVGNQPQWLLCYRASIHGWASSTFYNKCEGKSHTVIIIRNEEYVFGGYCDIPWVSNGGWGYTTNAFLFSLFNNEGMPPFKSIVTHPSFATLQRIDYGPTFGGAYDLYIANNANQNQNSYSHFGSGAYPVPSGVQNSRSILAGASNFSPEELEVFYLG